MKKDFEDRVKQTQASYQCDKLFEWDRWRIEIPEIQLKPNWKIRVIPPFGGAVIRFSVIDHNGSAVSVYLDCYSLIGSCDVPYWEIHPDSEGDCSRYLMEDVENLIKGIQQSFDYQNPTPYIQEVQEDPDITKNVPPDADNRFATVDLVMETD